MAGSDLAASDQEQEFVEANHFLKRPLLSEQAPGISRDQHAAPGSSPPANGAGGRGRITEILSEQRPLLLTNLLMLIPFVDEEHRAKNQAQFARNAAMLAPIEDESWEHVAFIAGIYGRYMWKQPLNEEQKRGMWQALLWAVRYEQYFRPKLVNDRCGEMLNFLNGSAQDAAFLQDASEDLTALLPDLNTLTVKKLAERLSRLTQVPQGVIEQFQAKIAEHLTLLPSPPTSRSGVPRSTLTPEAFSGERLVFEGKKQRGRYSLADRKIKRAAQQYGTAAVASGPARAWPAESYAALAFLGEEKSRKLLECIQASHLEHVSGILREARRGIFEALSQALADVLKHELLPPRRSLRIRGTHGVDLFPEARVAILSEEQESWRRALHLFEMGERQAGRKDFKMIAREWSLFAQARIYGPVKAAACWEEEYSQGVASWEEVWNLAAFYLKIQKPDLALNVLEPGVVSARAPFAHLRFALYCAVHILIGDEEGVSEATANGVVLNGKTARGRERVAGFLIQHLSKLPSLESYLTWQLLVDEHGESINLIEQMQMLSTFQAIMEHPVKLLAPEEEHSEEAIEALEKALRAIKLEESWCIWLNDYAERHPYNRKAWQHLSDTYERAHQLELAEKALQYITQMQLEQYQRNLQRGLAGQEIRYLRSNLIRLFEFYRRNTLPANGSAVFNTYYKALPELWDNHVAANKLLIDLTRPFMEGTLAAKAYKLPGGAASAWLPLQAELGNVYELAALKTLQKRLHRAIALLMASQKALREGLHEIRTLLDEVCALDAVRRQRGELQDEARLLNRRIQEACLLVRDENFAPLKALVAALQRVFGDFSTARQLVPQLQVQPTPLGYGLACDQPHTTLVVRVRNPGPGEVSNIRVTCSSEGRIVTRKEGVLSLLSEQGEGLIAIPVTTQLPPPGREYEQFGCQVHLHYQWGILQHLSSIQEVTVHWYSFQDFLQQHRIKDYEFPIPYVFDTAIDFHRHDRRLFQGREDEIQLIRSIFFKGQMKGAPLYFYGIRKVGKTSLLHRICLELEQGKFLPCVVDLHGIKAGQQTENVIVNTFTTRIVEQMAARGVNISGLRPVPVEQKNPLLEIERFLQGLRGRARERQIVLLLDEFHGLVAEHTAALLDLLRRVHQRDEILLIFSGWLHPSALQQACSQTQLFPLNAYAIDYLPLKVVRQVLQVPLADYGICIPEETLRQVYEQTAGNPYHVAKLAACGIALLNAEHRTVLAPQDVDEIAATLAKDPANFTSSSFSPLIFSPEEQNAAIRFAHDMNGREGLGREEASRIFDEVVVRRLEEKYLLERRDEGLAIRSRMLKAHLQSFQRPGTEPQLPRAAHRRVGIFVDYENLLPLLPAGMKAREVGEALIGHAARFGEVVCSWACADPRNIPDALGMRQGLEKAGFQVHYPRGEAHNGRVAKNLTDFALLERITDESAQSAPDTYLLVSGDRDYYEKIAALLDRGYVVRLVASTSNGHLAAKYVRLQEQRMQICHAEGLTKTDFFIDNLDEILQQAVEMLRK